MGWAFGGAVLAGFAELKQQDGWLSAETFCEAQADGTFDCKGLNFGYAGVMSVLCCMVVVVLKPFAEEIECGDSQLVNWLEDLLEDVWSMVCRAAAVTMFMLWEAVMREQAKSGTDGNASKRILFYYAISITFFGSLLTSTLEDFEGRLRRREAEDPGNKHRASVIILSDLLQSTAAYVVANAWTFVCWDTFTSLSAPPSMWAIGANVTITLSAVALALGWFVATGDTRKLAAGEGAEAGAVQRFFVSNTMAFFVGWVCVIVLRQLVAPLSLVVEGVVVERWEELEPATAAHVGDMCAARPSPLLTPTREGVAQAQPGRCSFRAALPSPTLRPTGRAGPGSRVPTLRSTGRVGPGSRVPTGRAGSGPAPDPHTC